MPPFQDPTQLIVATQPLSDTPPLPDAAAGLAGIAQLGSRSDHVHPVSPAQLSAAQAATMYAAEFIVSSPTGIATTDTANIVAAIAAAAAAKGGRVVLGQGTYLINAPIVITASNILIQGRGSDNNHNVGAINGQVGTQLFWTGGAGSMFSFSGPTGVTEQIRTGGGMKDVMLSGNNGAASVGLDVVSWYNGDFDNLYFDEFGVTDLRVTCSAGGAEDRDCQQNTFRDIGGRNVFGGSFITLDGITNANASLNYFENCNGVIGTALTNVGGFNLRNCDNNIFVRCRIYNSVAADSVVFHAGPVGQECRDNTFIGFTGNNNGAIRMKGTEEAASASYSNSMFQLDSGNGTATPQLGTTASGSWSFTNGTTRNRLVGLPAGDSISAADTALAQRGIATAYLVNGSDAHLVMASTDLSQKWAAAVLGANGNLRFVRLAGTGLLEVASDIKVNGQIGFNAATPINKPNVAGSRGGNAALASLLTALANYGLITDSTTP